MEPVVRVAPSILAADFTCLADEIRRAEAGGADLLHLDVMDGAFVPNISFGPLVVEAVRRVPRLPLDVHLMIEEPVRYVEAFAGAGARWLTVHVEACADVAGTLEEIRVQGLRPGLALRPGTPFAEVEPFLDALDLLLVMTVEPGFGGQSYMEDQEPKLARARQLRESAGHSYRIEVDGGIGRTTAPGAVAAGAEFLVAGSALFTDPDLPGFVSTLQKLAGSPSADPEQGSSAP